MACEFMDILTSIIYIILFIVLMIFVFSIGMLKRYMPTKKEILLILVVAFLIGCVGGAFFLEPIYSELPSVASSIEKSMPNNQETLYLDLSSSIDVNSLREELSAQEGFVSFDENSVSIPMWNFNQREHDYFYDIVGNIDSHYADYNVTENSIEITLEENYTSSEALKSFSDWYKLVYGETISYAQVHAVLVVESSSLDNFKQLLLDKGIVATKVEGPVQDSLNNTNSSMMPDTQFIAICGGVSVIVSILGIYMDTLVPSYRKFKRFIKEKRKR